MSQPVSSGVLWDPVRDKGRGRLLFIARPNDDVGAQIDALDVAQALSGQDRSVLFPRDNWHQSLSDRYVDTPHARHVLLNAGEQIRAPAFTLALDRLHSAANHRGCFNWDVRCQRGSDELKQLVAVINAAIVAQGFPKVAGIRRTSH